MGQITLRAAESGSQSPTQVSARTRDSGHRQSFTLSNGNILSVVISRDGDTFYVYETTSDRLTTTLRATIPLTGVLCVLLSGALAVNNDLWIGYVGGPRSNFKVCKLTYGTFAFSAWETVSPSLPYKIYAFDMDVSDAGVVGGFVLLNNGSTANNRSLYCRGTNNVWVATDGSPLTNATPRFGGWSCSMSFLGGAAGVRDVALAWGFTTTVADYGWTVGTMRITETNGVQQTALNARATYQVGQHSKSSTSTGGARNVSIVRTGTSAFAVAAQHTEVNKQLGVAQFSYDGAIPAWAVTKALATINGLGARCNAISATDKFINFYNLSDMKFRVTTFTLATSVWKDGTNHIFGYAYGTFPLEAGGGGNRNLQLSEMEIVFRSYLNINTTWPTLSGMIYASIPLPLSGQPIANLIPTNGSSLSSANPALRADVDFDKEYGQTGYKIQFQFATNPAFTANLIDYLQPDSKLMSVYGTQTEGVVVPFFDTLPVSYALTGILWYYRARIVDYWGNLAPWTATNTLAMQHPPYPEYISPVNGELIPWNNGEINFDWKFKDSSETDYQTAFQIVVMRATDNSVVLDTGKMASSQKRFVGTLAGINKDIQMFWKVNLWDSEDTQTITTETQYFTATDSPSAVINSPAVGSTVLTGVPTIVSTLTTGGGRVIKEYTVSVSQGGIVVWSVRTPGPFASGVQVSNKVPAWILNNNQGYTVQVTAIDSANLNASSSLTQFTVAWVSPAAPAGIVIDISTYNQDDEGYISVMWDDTTRDVDFASWIVYRKDDMIDPGTGFVLSEGQMQVVYNEYDTGIAYEFKDFFSPSNYRVSYLIKQAINRDGQDITSSNTAATTVIPVSDGYWLIEPYSDNANADAFKLSIVTGDSFTDEQEEAEMNIIGKGRRVEKGQRLGFKGTLDARLRNTNGTTARQKRIRLLEIQQVDSQLWLRNPFGDSFRVSVGAMSISRIAGVGASEFCDVNIPYSEVGGNE